MSSTNVARTAAKRLPLLPQRQKSHPRRDGALLEPLTQQVGDCFYRCAVELAKVVYTRIDNRYPFELRVENPKLIHEHKTKMDEARKILNEARNEVIEVVLPLFTINQREKGEDICNADSHAHDYIVSNIFEMMHKTYKAWADEFVDQKDVPVLERNIDKVFAVQRDRLEGMLLNFVFGFRQVAAKG